MTNTELSRILCPITLSTGARLVIERAAALAAVDDAEVRLFHVLPRPLEGQESPAMSAGGDDDPSARVLTKLFALASGVSGRTRMSAAVTEGDPSIEILRHAQIAHADLITIGMPGREERLSPVLQTIAATTECPVLTVHTSRPDVPACRSMLEILCCVNFLPASFAGVEYAVALARRTGGRVTMVHVLSERWDGPARDDSLIDAAHRRVQDQFRQLLHVTVRDLIQGADQTAAIVLSGSPSVEIVRLAHRMSSDLLVLGIDASRCGNEIGETAACAVQFSPCPVLLVPSDDSTGRPRAAGRN